mgnify:CR=1 FL=1
MTPPDAGAAAQDGDPGGEVGALAGLAPSGKLVAKVLEEEGAMPFDRIVRCTRLPRETARYGVDALVEAGVAERRRADGDVAVALRLDDPGSADGGGPDR